MTDQTISASLTTTAITPKVNTFGIRLKSAREAIGLDRKDAAQQLRLHEKMIIMIETGEYTTDIPMTFIRGYIRSYSKLLGIPDKELHEAMELLKPKPQENTAENTATPAYVTVKSPISSVEDHFMPIHFSSMFKPLFTFLLVVTLIALVGVWWHSHKATPHDLSSETTTLAQAPLPADAQNTPVNNATQQPKPTVMVSKPDASSFKQFMNRNQNIQHFIYLIMFLLIIKAGMRFYTAKPVMAGVRSGRIQRYSKPWFNVRLGGKAVKQVSIAIIVILAAATIGLWWHNHTKHQRLVTPAAKKPVVIAEKKNDIVDLQPLTGDLVQPATFNALLLSGIRPYLLQGMMLLLDNYITEAEASYFELTDKSTPIGQFEGKKKRRHRVYDYQRVHNYPSYDNENSSQPPYYYQQ